MTTIKSYTDLEQSKKLTEILPLESADMHYWQKGQILGVGHSKELQKGFESKRIDYIPCWSLAALLDVLPVIIGDVLSENALRLRIDKSETKFNVWYDNLDTGMVEEGFDIIETNPVDACVAMIEKLNELNLL